MESYSASYLGNSLNPSSIPEWANMAERELAEKQHSCNQHVEACTTAEQYQTIALPHHDSSGGAPIQSKMYATPFVCAGEGTWTDENGNQHTTPVSDRVLPVIRAICERDNLGSNPVKKYYLDMSRQSDIDSAAKAKAKKGNLPPPPPHDCSDLFNATDAGLTFILEGIVHYLADWTIKIKVDYVNKEECVTAKKLEAIAHKADPKKNSKKKPKTKRQAKKSSKKPFRQASTRQTLVQHSDTHDVAATTPSSDPNVPFLSAHAPTAAVMSDPYNVASVFEARPIISALDAIADDCLFEMDEDAELPPEFLTGGLADDIACFSSPSATEFPSTPHPSDALSVASRAHDYASIPPTDSSFPNSGPDVFSPHHITPSTPGSWSSSSLEGHAWRRDRHAASLPHFDMQPSPKGSHVAGLSLFDVPQSPTGRQPVSKRFKELASLSSHVVPVAVAIPATLPPKPFKRQSRDSLRVRQQAAPPSNLSGALVDEQHANLAEPFANFSQGMPRPPPTSPYSTPTSPHGDPVSIPLSASLPGILPENSSSVW
eukprot:m.8626 g.8626  ORF g.8626 m.8626 type:complete len:543 (-) comp9228_c0_seq2:177-1805(-)